MNSPASEFGKGVKNILVRFRPARPGGVAAAQESYNTPPDPEREPRPGCAQSRPLDERPGGRQRGSMPIRVDLLRHGVSDPSHDGGDAARELVPQGKAAIRTLGEALKRSDWRPELALSSPYRRACDTLAVLLKAAGLSLEPGIEGALEPESTPDELERALIAQLGRCRHVVLVSHMPLVAQLARYWTGTPVAFRPGELLGIEFKTAIAPGAGHIVEQITPHR